jgi:uroporphyrinogen-III synthase
MSKSVAAPLAGKQILVTRTREQASVLSERLHALGALPVEFPTIRIVPPTDWHALDTALKRLYASDGTGYDWLVLTSANGVHICMQRLQELGYDPGAMRNVRVATIGPATAAALAEYGVIADLVPDEYIAEGVTRALLEDARQRQLPLTGQRILLARAAEARKILFTELQQAGALVDEVPAYYTLPVARSDERGREVFRLLQNGQLDILTFTSSSTVRNFVAWLKSFIAANLSEASAERVGWGNTDDDIAANLSEASAERVGWGNTDDDVSEQSDQILEQMTSNTQLASIGPITSQTARQLGLRIDIEAKEFTIDGLVDAIVLYEELLNGHLSGASPEGVDRRNTEESHDRSNNSVPNK